MLQYRLIACLKQARMELRLDRRPHIVVVGKETAEERPLLFTSHGHLTLSPIRAAPPSRGQDHRHAIGL